MRAVDAVARFLWEQGEGLDIYTDPLEPLRGAHSVEEVSA
jgi:hypothetical protein